MGGRKAARAGQTRKGSDRNHAIAPWDWEADRQRVGKHGPTRGNLATGSRENALNSRTAVRCPQG